ncbi:MAG: hypothetical protein H7Z42_02465 [Roseiflexaceae bacterium]|nr:hypothetical protein [Roseiflexaceae bacterium]
MKNKLLLALILIAAIFPFAVTGIELRDNLTALLALAGMSLVAVAITAVAMLYRIKPDPGSEMPKQAIPTIKQAPAQEATTKQAPAQEATPTVAPARPAVPAKKPSKPDPKRQKVP